MNNTHILRVDVGQVIIQRRDLSHVGHNDRKVIVLFTFTPAGEDGTAFNPITGVTDESLHPVTEERPCEERVFRCSEEIPCTLPELGADRTEPAPILSATCA